MIKLNHSQSNTPKSIDQEPFSINLQNSLLSFTTDPQVLPKTLQLNKNIKAIPQTIFSIIEKNSEDRTSVQNSTLIKYLLKFKIFKDLVEKFSIDVIKHMIKEGVLKLYNQGDLLAHLGKKIKKVRILLKGQVSSIVEDGKQEQRQYIWQILDQVVQKVGRQTKKFKNSSQKNINQTMNPSFIYRKQTTKEYNFTQFTHKIQPNSILNYLPLIEDQPKHTQTLVVTKNQTLIFMIGIHQFFQSLFLFYNAKMNQVIKTFKKTPIFNSFQNSKLKILVQKLQSVEIKKNQFVFKQGDLSKCFYLLTEGQVQISKNIQILVQNPNNLYKSRAKISKEHQNKDIKILPYANFNRVYHYEPERKKIILAVINPICVFGQEQVVQGINRQVSAKVSSLKSKMYKIPLNDVQQLCAKLSDSAIDRKLALINFFSLIEESITLKKVLFRQNFLAEMIQHQNRNKYSTLFSDQIKRKSVKSSNISRRKYTLQTPRKKQILFDDDVPPTYNHLNFTDLQKTNYQELQKLPSQPLTTDEVKIAKLMHRIFSNELMKQTKDKKKYKQIRIRNKSNKTLSNKKLTLDSSYLNNSYLTSSSPFKSKKKLSQKRDSHKITLQNPLFNMNYFRNQQQCQKKLVFIAKKKKLQQIYRSSF